MKQRFGIISVAGRSPNGAETLVLGPGYLDMTFKKTISADGSVEPVFARRTLDQEILTPMAFKTRIITYLPNMEFALRPIRRRELLKKELILLVLKRRGKGPSWMS
jgi:hypothetical protein